MKKKPLLVRHAAVLVLGEVLHKGRSLATALPPAMMRTRAAERGLLQELCYGSLRWHERLQALAALLLERPLRSRDRDVQILLLLGLYQLLYLNIPAHAAVSLTVDASVSLQKPWARGLLNGVLRHLLRERDALLAKLDAEETSVLSHPRWLLARLARDWPEHWQDIARANNARPPMSLRVNRLQGSREEYLSRLTHAGIPAQADPLVASALILDTPQPVERLPGFAEGAVSVQDSAAQLAAGLLQLAPGQRVLDACAAPGGKTGHLLETCPDIDLLALDSDAVRLQRVEENLQRLQLAAGLVAGDAGQPDDWRNGRLFDRILLDAPCSGSGVIRRHPDIKHLRRAEDITQLAGEQARLLHALWPLLSPGGILVYATCSVFTAENAGQIRTFLQERHDARELPICTEWGHPVAAGRQILPGEYGMDGFYYAVLHKQ